MFGSMARDERSSVGTASGGGKQEGNPTWQEGLTGWAVVAFPHVRGGVAGTGFEPV
jgi:hypothetical protein